MRKRIIVCVLVFLMATLTACGTKKAVKEDETPKEEQRKNVIETDEDTGEEYYLLADFENYFECSQVNYIASFGTVTEVTKEEEPDMVPYGNQSVKLKILGTESSWKLRRPTMRVETGSAFFDKTTDFSNMSRLTFDIYNAQDYEASIRFWIDGEISNGYSQIMSIFTNTDYQYNIVNIIDLKPNSWNHIEIPAEEIRKVQYDESGKPYFVYGEEALKEVGGFDFEFDRGEVHEEQEVFYFDNVRAYLKK